MVQRHLDLVKPGGVALIAVPNYGGVYGSLQGWFDAPNLALHNLEIMDARALELLVDAQDAGSVRAYPSGAMCPWLVSFDKRLPRFVARFLNLGVNALGLLQPMMIEALAPLLVLEVRKRPNT